MIQPRYLEERPRIKNPRQARGATETRRKHAARARYAALSKFSIGLTILSSLLIGYVMLTSNRTGMTYAVAKAQAQRANLQGETGRLDDRITVLRSQERLAAFAARLGMHDPQQFALVRVAPARTDAGHLALLSTFASFFGSHPAAPSVR